MVSGLGAHGSCTAKIFGWHLHNYWRIRALRRHPSGRRAEFRTAAHRLLPFAGRPHQRVGTRRPRDYHGRPQHFHPLAAHSRRALLWPSNAYAADSSGRDHLRTRAKEPLRSVATARNEASNRDLLAELCDRAGCAVVNTFLHFFTETGASQGHLPRVGRGIPDKRKP